MPPRIVLIRHGESAHVLRERVDRDGFLRWLETYDLAGLAEGEAPPSSLRSIEGHVVASDIRRAHESALMLAANVVTSPLLREVELDVPRCGGLRLPMSLWGLVVGLRWKFGARHGLERAREAARWLASLAEEHGTVVAVTHGAMRRLIADALVEDGWTCAYPEKRKWATWSAWTLVSAGSSLPAAARSR
ncbi:MAG: hypothetical protein ACLGH0_09350 [Thermoanaerobaculia bacterium]